MDWKHESHLVGISNVQSMLIPWHKNATSSTFHNTMFSASDLSKLNMRPPSTTGPHVDMRNPLGADVSVPAY